jgi:ribosomal protein L37E
MVAFEVLGGLLVAGLATATTFAALVGLLGVLGALRFVRCNRCGRLGVAKSAQPVASCAYCRHETMAYPLHALAHVHVGHPHLERPR